MGSIAGGNTTLRSSRVGCQNEQQTTENRSPGLVLKSRTFWQQKVLVAVRGRNPAPLESGSPRTAVRKWGDPSTSLRMTVEVFARDDGD